MVNEHDLKDWHNKPIKTASEATTDTTWGIPIVFDIKRLLGLLNEAQTETTRKGH